MAIDPRLALVALNRFGLGAAPGELNRAAADPRGYVLAQINPAAIKPLDSVAGFAALKDSAANLIEAREADKMRRAAKLAEANAAASAPAMRDEAAGGAMMAPGGAMAPAPKRPDNPEAENFRAEVAARFARLLGTENGLVERLTLFWSNHFAVSAAKGPGLRMLCGSFEREAIRPYVLGRFGDMLKAVEQHQAMLYYLDNHQSVGPTSKGGQNGKRGLNENLAREILELHTLGVDGGYGQADVTSLSRIITGWTVTSPDEDLLHGGRFTFAPARHEPGDHVVLGKTYAQDDQRQGEAVLADLAVHPATARHLARKLATHFVADQPPKMLVERLAKTFLDSKGDLAAVARVLVSAPEAWSAPATKLRTPQDFLIAAFRATGKTPDPGAIAGVLQVMGQPLWQPIGPNGFSDQSAEWASPEGVSARLDAAAQWGRQNAKLDPQALLETTIGPAASAETRQAVARAESRAQAVALVFMSPEFQRR
ncbi:DUF1800 family protein [Alsobacter sp. KACC 23698]|uniref:DUF1800 family protein n=1 Tax=Alsobacter sp. KACC 23698 TaxID=3149229 RepID=A0AAU7JBG9_9HYPH